jgi:hypothetical protein
VPDWDADSPELRHNLTRLLEEIADKADQRETPTIELAREWQRRIMQGLTAEPRYIDSFRGEPGLKRTGVRIWLRDRVWAPALSRQLRETGTVHPCADLFQ